MDVAVIGITAPNWVELDGFYMRNLYWKPTTKLKTSALKLDNAMSMAAILETAAVDLQAISGGFRVCYLTVAVIFNKADTLKKVMSHNEFQVVLLEDNAAIVAASFKDWHDIILTGLNGSKTEMQAFLSCVLLLMEMNGFRTLFSRYKRVKIEQGIFQLWRK